MMWYAIVSEDIPESLALRQANRPAHLARLEALQEEGRLMIAGPFPAVDSTEPGDAGFEGSLVVAEFADLNAAQAWADTDPYLLGGVYRKTTVRPFKPVFPK